MNFLVPCHANLVSYGSFIADIYQVEDGVWVGLFGFGFGFGFAFVLVLHHNYDA